jgi:hypothetical protein
MGLREAQGLREMGAGWDNGQSVICVAIWRNLRNLWTIVKAGTMGPLITQITQIMDAQDLRVARTCGKWARDSGRIMMVRELRELTRLDLNNSRSFADKTDAGGSGLAGNGRGMGQRAERNLRRHLAQSA